MMRLPFASAWLNGSHSSLMLVLLALMQIDVASALNPDRDLVQYTRQTWSLDEGLPQASVTAVVQGPNRYLYIATFGGLVRFDGLRFRPIPDAGGCGNRFATLAVDESGTLWAGVSRGGLCRMEVQQGREVLVPFEADGNVVVTGINSLRARSGGGVWVATLNGLFEIVGNQARYLGSEYNLPDGHLTNLLEASDGGLWVLSNSGICKLTGDTCTVPEWAESLEPGRAKAVVETRSGELWFNQLDKLFRVRDDTLERIELPGDLGLIADLFEDRQGNLWMATSRAGLKRIRQGPVPRLSRGLTGRNARTVFEDRENNLWVGYSGDGLERWSDGVAYGVHVPDASNSLDVMAIEEAADGGLWVAVPCTGLAHLINGQTQIIETEALLGSGCVWSLLAEPDGRLWVGMLNGLALRTAAGEFISQPPPPSQEGLVRALARDPSTGDLLVGSDEGVYRFRDETGAFELIEGTEHLDVHFVTAEPDGSVWAGTRDGAVRIRAEGRQRFGRAEGLASNYVRAIRIDPDGVVWLGTYGGGLHRMEDGRIVHFGPHNGLPDNVVSRIVEDDQHRFWMTGNLGVTRVAREQLEAYARGELDEINARLFNARDGMPISETNGGGQPAGMLRRNGEFWVPTIDGLAVFDTRASDQMLDPPPVLIERILVDGQRLNMDEDITLPATARNFEIHYSAPAYRAPERVRFRYRLDGFDSQWTDAADRRVAYFPIIPPGDLVFRAVAARGSGPWSESEARLAIRMEPRFTQTWLFVPTVVVAVATLAGLLFWIRNRSQRMRERELKHEVEKRTAELKRLATLDPLTGVPNRRAFDQRLKSEWLRLKRSRQPLSVLLLDVDHFKSYNDHYGHQAGDACLQTLAGALSEALGTEQALIARIGGEEFGIVLAANEATRAIDTAQRLRRAVEQLALPHEGRPDCSIVTVSIGVASMRPARDRDTTALVRAADDALYDAKRNGRNRVAHA